MKKLTILSAIAMSGLIYSTANAQMSIRVGFHFGTPVAVQSAPVYEEPAPVSYDGDDDYYYLPDVDAYYSVSEQCYYYFDGDSWISAAFLPGEYRDYNWRTARRYEIRAPRPYMHAEIYRSRYKGHEVSAWGRYNNYEHYNAPVQRNYRDRFDNRTDGAYRQPGERYNGQRFEYRGQGTYNQPELSNGRHWGNRPEGGYNQQAPQNNGQRWGGYNQSAPQNNGQRFNNSEQGSPSQSAEPGRWERGNNQPANQYGGNHYTQNSPRGGFSARTMTRF